MRDDTGSAQHAQADELAPSSGFRGYLIGKAALFREDWKPLELSSHETLICVALGNRTDSAGEIFVSLAQLASWCKCAENTIRKAVRRLVALELLAMQPSAPGRPIRMRWRADCPYVRRAVGDAAADAVLAGDAHRWRAHKAAEKAAKRWARHAPVEGPELVHALDCLGYELARQRAAALGVELEGDSRDPTLADLSPAKRELLGSFLVHQSRLHRQALTVIAERMVRVYFALAGRENWLRDRGHPVGELATEKQLAEVARLLASETRRHQAAVRALEREQEEATAAAPATSATDDARHAHVTAVRPATAEHLAGAASAAAAVLERLRANGAGT